jgi:hypothetical protein
VVTTKHVIEGHPNSYIWHPDDELMSSYRPTRYWIIGENALVETDKSMPFPAFPISMKPTEDVVGPGASVVYPGGAEYYQAISPDTLVMNVGVYNGKIDTSEHLVYGRIAGGTSGAGIASVEDGMLIGIVYGQYTIQYLEQSISFQDANLLKRSIEQQIVTPLATPAEGPSLTSKYLPDIQNKYLSYAIYSLAGIGGLLIAKELIS